ncbi:MAG: hypothetical protein ACLGI3_06530 [Actinomycetes bacterium]
MNHYGRLVHDHWRRHRPAALRQITDPDTHFTSLGEAIQTAVTSLRDEILGPPAPNLEDFRNRSYQALRQAEELVLHDVLSEATAETTETDTDPETLVYRARLALVSKATSRLAADWTEEAPAQP